ncbi:unnamed protein product [Bursaphelenchus okinawaensis]|uniref:Major facilitator superfamily (MFS) profile domain-containing protein n=1 Tax=Bursaphelenchus okinawaensis TaxID=465554 RepID=A0A811LHV7_9BILA|nr:unnamed protein product [Bursaphelenchus okinawaensis]CAG9125906.1 unnamed protein product [Bursaphelenchus okinawaensis]
MNNVKPRATTTSSLTHLNSEAASDQATVLGYLSPTTVSNCLKPFQTVRSRGMELVGIKVNSNLMKLPLTVFRYFILTLTLLTLAISLSCFICFNVSVVQMTNLSSSPYYNESQLDPSYYSSLDIPLHDRRFDLSNFERAWIYAAPFLGACVFAVPVAWMMSVIGTRYTQILVGILSSVVTVITPWTLSGLPVWLFVIIRTFQGAALANLYPVIGVVVARWSPASEKGFFLSTLTGYLQISCIIAMPLAGALVQYLNWPIVFYVHGVVAFLMYVLWFIFFTDHPKDNMFLSKTELGIIQHKKGVPTPVQRVSIWRILSTPSVLAVFVAVFGNFMTFNFANTFFPSYLNSLFGFSSLDAALIVTLVLLLQFIVKIVTGLITDRLTGTSDEVKIKWCNSIAFCGTALFLSVASIVPPKWNHPVAIVAISLPYVLLGANGGGFPRSAMLISGQEAPTVMALFQVVLCTSFLISSLTVPVIVPDSTFDEWKHVFVLYVVLLLSTNAIFVAFGSAAPATFGQKKNLIVP